MNDFSSSSPHLNILYKNNVIFPNYHQFNVFDCLNICLGFKTVEIKKGKNIVDVLMLELNYNVLKLDLPSITLKITRFIKDYIKKSKANGVVLGISGGVDSCTTAALAALSLGGNKVLGLMLPERETLNENDIHHTKLIADKFGFNLEVIDISSTHIY